MIRFADSVRQIFNVLKREGETTVRRLSEELKLPPRTIRYAIEKLNDKNLVRRHRSLGDMRVVKYELKSEFKFKGDKSK